MTTYYIVTQADTDKNGHINDATGVFDNEDGNTELYINGEEARESIANEVANMVDGTELNISINDADTFTATSWKEAYEYVMKNMKPEARQYVLLMWSDGSERSYTINAIQI
jgi:hypothetical protein